MRGFLWLSVITIAAIGIGGASSSRSEPCTPGYIRLGTDRVLASDGWNGSRVLIIGCEERLGRVSAAEKAELEAQLSAFFDRSGWTFWWAAKDRDERLQVLRLTKGFREGNFTDFLLYDPVSGEP